MNVTEHSECSKPSELQNQGGTEDSIRSGMFAGVASQFLSWTSKGLLFVTAPQSFEYYSPKPCFMTFPVWAVHYQKLGFLKNVVRSS